MNMPDKNMRSIPKNRGNIPVPAIRKVPMGILKERNVVIAPKRKITIPTIISSLFTRFPPRISDCRFQIFPRSRTGAWKRDENKWLSYSIPNVRFGSHKAISGQKITKMTTTTVDNINSQPSLTKSQSEHLKIVQTI